MLPGTLIRAAVAAASIPVTERPDVTPGVFQTAVAAARHGYRRAVGHVHVGGGHAFAAIRDNAREWARSNARVPAGRPLCYQR